MRSSLVVLGLLGCVAVACGGEDGAAGAAGEPGRFRGNTRYLLATALWPADR